MIGLPTPGSLVRRVHWLALAAVVALAGCANKDPVLPGERIPVRPEDAPIASGARQGLGIPAPVVNAEWSHRNGAARGRLVNPALRPVPQLIWSVDIGAGDDKRTRVLTGPIVAGGLVFAMDAAGRVTAVTRSGQVAWTRSVVPEGQQADALLEGNARAAIPVLEHAEQLADSPEAADEVRWQLANALLSLSKKSAARRALDLLSQVAAGSSDRSPAAASLHDRLATQLEG
jgi:hypothetical protein